MSDSEDDVPLAQRAAAAPGAPASELPSSAAGTSAPHHNGAGPRPASGSTGGATNGKPVAAHLHGRQVVSDSDSEDEVPLAARAPAAPAAKPAQPAAEAKPAARPSKPAAPATATAAKPKPAGPALPKRGNALLDEPEALPAAPKLPPKPKPVAPPVAPKRDAPADDDDSSDDDQPLAARKAKKATPGACLQQLYARSMLQGIWASCVPPCRPLGVAQAGSPASRPQHPPSNRR